MKNKFFKSIFNLFIIIALFSYLNINICNNDMGTFALLCLKLYKTHPCAAENRSRPPGVISCLTLIGNHHGIYYSHNPWVCLDFLHA